MGTLTERINTHLTAAVYGPRRMVGEAPSAIRPAQVAPARERMIARVIDWIIFGSVGLAHLVAFGFPSASDVRWFQPLILTVAYWLIEWIPVALFGGSLGKLARHIRIVDAASGESIGVARSGLRTALALVGLLAVVDLVTVATWVWATVGAASAVLILRTEYRRSVMDRVAGTVVVLAPTEQRDLGPDWLS